MAKKIDIEEFELCRAAPLGDSEQILGRYQPTFRNLFLLVQKSMSI
jgi:hypothetical protein